MNTYIFLLTDVYVDSTWGGGNIKVVIKISHYISQGVRTSKLITVPSVVTAVTWNSNTYKRSPILHRHDYTSKSHFQRTRFKTSGVADVPGSYAAVSSCHTTALVLLMPDTTGTRLRRNKINWGKKAKAQPFSFYSGKQTCSCPYLILLLQCCATVPPLSYPGTLSHYERNYTPKPTQRLVSPGRRRFSQLS